MSMNIGISEASKIGEVSKSFELKIDEVLADHISTLAIEKIEPKKIEEAVNFAIDRFTKVERKYWSTDLSAFDRLVINSFLKKVESHVQEIIDNEINDQKSREIAERIVKNSKEASEKYLTQAIANRMCLLYTDFDNNMRKIDIYKVVDEIISSNNNR